MSDFFADAEVISRYSRAQAIEDGVLVDVSETAREAGFKWPVAMTNTAWADTVEWDDSNSAIQDEAGRLWDVLWMTFVAVRRGGRGDRLDVEVLRIPNDPTAKTAHVARLVAHCGPGDTAEPVITIMLPGED